MRTINLDDEYILCSAIWFDDKKEHVHQPKNIITGFVVCGQRHHNCYMTISILTNDSKDVKRYNAVQGFLTSHNRFIDRREANDLAYRNGQITKSVNILFSEDLY